MSLSGNSRISAKAELEFDQVMGHSKGVQFMTAFAASEYSDENLLFWTAVRDYKRDTLDGCPSTQLQAAGATIIDTYLCASAEKQVNISSKYLDAFSKPAAEGQYEFTASTFDSAAGIVYKMIQQDTFGRFKLSNQAEDLIDLEPLLAVADVTAPFSSASVQRMLKEHLSAAQELTGCERVTAWLVSDRLMWSIASTALGNAILKVPVGVGIAGVAATSDADVFVDNAYEDPRFDASFDQVTGFKTRSVMCVVLKREKTVRGVLQLLNKRSEAGKIAPFSEDDAAALRKVDLLAKLLDACEDVAVDAAWAAGSSDKPAEATEPAPSAAPSAEQDTSAPAAEKAANSLAC